MLIKRVMSNHCRTPRHKTPSVISTTTFISKHLNTWAVDHCRDRWFLLFLQRVCTSNVQRSGKGKRKKWAMSLCENLGDFSIWNLFGSNWLMQAFLKIGPVSWRVLQQNVCKVNLWATFFWPSLLCPDQIKPKGKEKKLHFSVGILLDT